MAKNGKRWVVASICAASGALAGLCLLVPAWGALVWVAACPALCRVLWQTERRGLFGLCLAFGLGFCMVAYTPAFSLTLGQGTAVDFGLGLGLYAAACVLHGVPFALALWTGARLPCAAAARPVALALCWALVEWFCGLGPLAWPVARLSLALWAQPVFIQGASVFGMLFVSVLVLAVNGWLAMAVLQVMAILQARAALRREGEERPAAGVAAPVKHVGKAAQYAAVAATLFLGNLVWGGLALAPLQSNAATKGQTATVALVQPGAASAQDENNTNYSNSLIWAWQAAKEQQADYILLPEGVAGGSLQFSPAEQETWGNIASAADAWLLLGGWQTTLWDTTTGQRLTDEELLLANWGETLPDGSLRYERQGRSAAFLFAPNGQLVAVVPKQRLVPFFENGKGVPFTLNTRTEGGPRPAAQAGGLGVLTCYESLFAGEARAAANAGATLLAVPTNDSWFQSDAAKRMHLGHGVYRAVETGRSLAQVGTNGLSATVDAYGRVTAALPAGETSLLEAPVSTAPRGTFYLRWGDAPLALAAAALGLHLVLHAKTNIKMQRQAMKMPG